MRLEPLYRLRFDYPESWSVSIAGDGGEEQEHFLFARGAAEGRIVGEFRGANAPHRRVDRTFEPRFRGVIETTDGATILLEYGGYGRAYREPYTTQSPNRRQWVATARHWSDAPRYRWLCDSVCVGTGEIRPKLVGATEGNPTDLVLDVSELIWEPLPD